MEWCIIDLMSFRKIPLVNGQYYHIFTRSIAGFSVFNDNDDFSRMESLLGVYRFKDFVYKYSRFISSDLIMQNAIIARLEKGSPLLVKIVAFSTMPTHIHLILQQTLDNGISKFISDVLNSYTRYFNVKHKRKGPLWEGPFNNVLIKTDEQIIHLTRYIHLNSTTAGLTKNPEDWIYSSYRAYIGMTGKNFCDFEFLDIKPTKYRKFVTDQKLYQKELALIKSLLIDHYTG